MPAGKVLNRFKWSDSMEHNIQVPEAVFQRAKVKAEREGVVVDQVARDLLTRWVDGQIHLVT